MGTPNARGLTSLRQAQDAPQLEHGSLIDAPWNGSYGIVYKYTYVSIKKNVRMYICENIY